MAAPRSHFINEPLAPAGGSIALIQNKLSDAAVYKVECIQGGKAKRVFSKEDIQKINSLYDAFPDFLKEITDAVFLDINTLGIVAEPVFIRGDGHINDATFIKNWLGDNEKKTCIENPNISFTKEDIIPCNTLINAMEILLISMDASLLSAACVADKLPLLHLPQKSYRISAENMEKINHLSLLMSPFQKNLLDSICKDPMTGSLMDDPVLLPDGYVYNKNLALYFLKERDGQCPLNPAIQFTEAELTPCYFVISFIDKIIEHSRKLEEAMSAEKVLVSLPHHDLESHRNDLLKSIDKLLFDISKNKFEICNPHMPAILQSAMQSLILVNPEILIEAKKQYPKYNLQGPKISGMPHDLRQAGQIVVEHIIKVELALNKFLAAMPCLSNQSKKEKISCYWPRVFSNLTGGQYPKGERERFQL